MFRDYLKIAIRNLKKNKLHSFINIAGLAIGMAVSVLILSYVWYELSFDTFHSRSHNIYRVTQTRNLWSTGKNSFVLGATGTGLASALKEEIPEIIHIARSANLSRESEIEVQYEENKFSVNSWDFVRADNDIFKIFDIELIYGNPETALLEPNSVVITEEESKKIFGNGNPLGKSISEHFVGNERVFQLNVTGVAKALPVNSHFHFKYLIPYRNKSGSFIFQGTNTYLTLPEGYPPENLENKFPGIVKKYFVPGIERIAAKSYSEWLETGGVYKLGLQPLKKIHLDSKLTELPGSRIKKESRSRVRIFAVVAFFIIVLASVNFIILSTAKAGSRAKEVGVRKVAGAGKILLMKQFLIESVLLSCISLIIAIVLILFLSKPFNNLIQIQTQFNIAGISFLVTALFLVSMFVGIFAGIYPAFVLSSFKPVNVLKGQLSEKKKRLSVRNSLVVFQFIISVLLIISGTVIYKQFVYMQHKDLGFDKEHIVIIYNIHELWNRKYVPSEEQEIRLTSFRQELQRNQYIKSTSCLSALPGMWGHQWGNVRVRPERDFSKANYRINESRIDFNFAEVFQLEMAAGRNFKKTEIFPQNREGVILNEKAVKYLGMEDPVGKLIYANLADLVKNEENDFDVVRKEILIPVIGVFMDFHNRDLYSDIQPNLFTPIKKKNIDIHTRFFAIRFQPGNITNNISFLKETWGKFVPDIPLEYSFFDKEFDALYNKEKKLAQIFTFFILLAIFIACLGIFGLAAFTAEQRTKEIGIRKAMGATTENIVEILVRIYLKLIIIALLIACPVGYIVMNRWLQNFPYHKNIGIAVFLIAIVIILFIVLSSVSYHSIKAALTNPARTLKYE